MTRMQELYRTRKAAGLCGYCGRRPPEEGRVSCRECGERQKSYSRNRRSALRAMGRCVGCGKKIDTGYGLAVCEECHDRMTGGLALYRQEHPEKSRERAREYHRRRKENGICNSCGKPSRPGMWRCQSCQKKLTLKNAERRRANARVPFLDRPEWPSYGFCYICGGKIDEGGTGKVCAKCRDTLSENIAKGREAIKKRGIKWEWG